MQNQNPVSQFITEVINHGDTHHFNQLIAADYHFQSGAIELHGRQALKDLLAAYRQAFPDITIHIDDQVQNDQRIVTRGRLTGTHCGEFNGLPATNREVCVDLVLISTIEHGAISKEFELLDELRLLRQLGAVV